MTSTATMVTTTRQASALATTATVEMLRAVSEGHPLSFASTGDRVLLEYVSANPNGPVTAIHGRGGVLGQNLSTLLATTGVSVTREFYVNDATSSRQMRQFARAVLGRYRQMFGQTAWAGIAGSGNDAEGYPEEYITRTAQHLIDAVGDKFSGMSDEAALLPLQETTTSLLQQEQRETLAALGIAFDNWFSENGLHAGGAVERTLQRLRDAGHAYEHGNALWLRSTAFGDEADRVLRRADGSPTYLAGDLAYHADKFDRGFDRLVDVWDADHASYIERTRAGLAALGYDPARLTVLLVGPVRLLRDGTEVKASRLDGLIEIVTLAELLTELDPDGIRWSFASASSARPVDVDADRLRHPDNSNPLWRLRYARTVCRWVEENGGEAIDGALAERVMAFPEIVQKAASGYAPHLVAKYALELATDWTAHVAGGQQPAALLARAVGATLEQSLRLLGMDLKDENA